MDNIVYEDGQGNLYNDRSMEVAVLEMEVDQEMYPIETVTNFAMYHELKLPEKPKNKTQKQQDTGNTYKNYKDSEKEQLFALVYERGI
ncbi:hypothetical protein BD408DRAFT_348856 [Parasitella parasitica]|nr:hypothetical protein BD408DRAFT_348856 [Parasitella parasitica]